jgi:hypothetical protein
VGQTGDPEAVRVETRQLAILRTNTTLPSDDNDWHLDGYLPGVVAWLYDWSKVNGGLGSLLDVLDIEHRYPGLLHAVDTFAWQVELIRQQAANGNE